jgi:hypothetical protein
MRKYDVIFGDWDGTAVLSRTAPIDDIVSAMTPLLRRGTKLVVVSGTDIENVGGGKLASFFPAELRSGLYMGLARGARNYAFDGDGDIVELEGILPDRRKMSALHNVCFTFHEFLYNHYGLNTDIVFNRDNYCKIDLMPDMSRGNQLYFRGQDIKRLNNRLADHGYTEGLRGLFSLAEVIGRHYKLTLKPTTDAKYLELGFGTKADNVDMLYHHLETTRGRRAFDCCFWGDEYLKMDEGVYGSDAYMITDTTKDCDFFDVSVADGERPPQVRCLGGGVRRFVSFLREQALKRRSA